MMRDGATLDKARVIDIVQVVEEGGGVGGGEQQPQHRLADARQGRGGVVFVVGEGIAELLQLRVPPDQGTRMGAHD
ncbi:hypothetical protein JGS22_002895 [Streptomyces sp. P38-E01]|uniref:Uncharacterized protein n=1 Tax=Streptomyces tardus TaxID=2780544 RepID=A0A949JK30_9ACTN|nr:hypothetical protein [Streptomyces tardus]MBU7596611.1 hypothetical protein [Streptomyces tardus]